MPIPASCFACGWNGKLKDEFAGKRGRCPACREIIQVPAIASEAEYGDYDVVDDDPPAKPALSKRVRNDDVDRTPRSRPRDDDEDDRPRSRRRNEDDDDESSRPKSRFHKAVDDEDERPRSRRRDEDERPRSRRRDEEDDDRSTKSRSKIKKKKKKDDSEQTHQLTGTAAMIGGIGMMIGAVVWFVLGLVYQDKIYFYPPVLFVLGIGAFIRGMQEESDRH